MTGKRLAPSDPGPAGTLRWQRVMVRDVTQRDLAAACELSQADVHNYESAKVFLTRRRAKQLAQGLFPRLSIGDPHGALLHVYDLWLATVAAFGAPGMKARARKLREDLAALGWRLPLQAAGETPGFAADVCTLADAPAAPTPKERRA